MSGLPLGAPLRRSLNNSSSLRHFDHIPRLREVLAHGGWPGAVYAQVCIHNLKAARERTERPGSLDELQGGSIYYTIAGPKGMAQVALVGTGDVIPGASPESGNRLFFTDGEIGLLTGHAIQYPIWLRPQEEDHARRRQVPVQEEPEGREGDGRVEGRQPAQRIKKRTQGDIAQAGRRDRAVRSRDIQALRSRSVPTEKQLAARKAASERLKAMHAARRAT